MGLGVVLGGVVVEDDVVDDGVVHSVVCLVVVCVVCRSLVVVGWVSPALLELQEEVVRWLVVVRFVVVLVLCHQLATELDTRQRIAYVVGVVQGKVVCRLLLGAVCKWSRMTCVCVVVV